MALKIKFQNGDTLTLEGDENTFDNIWKLISQTHGRTIKIGEAIVMLDQVLFIQEVVEEE